MTPNDNKLPERVWLKSDHTWSTVLNATPPPGKLAYIHESHLTTLKAELALAKQQIEEWREALEFYADKKNYGSDDYSRTDGFDCFDVVLNDFSQSDTKNCSRHAGRRAKQALAKWPRKESGDET
jgi:hypothetical protein